MTDNNQYSNFNGYEAQPAQPIYIQAAPVQDNSGKKKANGLGITSVVLAPLSCCCCGFSSLIGLILAIVGLSKDKGNAWCIVGLILSALALIYNIYSIASVDWSQFTQMYQEAMTDPESFMENYGDYMQGYSAAISFFKR